MLKNTYRRTNSEGGAKAGKLLKFVQNQSRANKKKKKKKCSSDLETEETSERGLKMAVKGDGGDTLEMRQLGRRGPDEQRKMTTQRPNCRCKERTRCV